MSKFAPIPGPQPGAGDAESRLYQVLSNIPALVGRFDRDERCVFTNESVQRLYGMTAEQLIGMRLPELLDAESYSLYLPHIPLVLAGERARFEGCDQRDGRLLHYQVNLVPDSGATGEVIGFFLMTFDVTALKLAQVEHQRAEARLRAITDNLPVLITYVDSEQRLQFANRTWADWSGQPVARAIGKPLRDIIGADLHGERDGSLQRALAGERVELDLESELHGVRRSLQTVYIPDVNTAGQVAGVYTLTTDVTRLRQAERQMAELALSDPLTALPNRRRLNERLPEALARAQRQNSDLGVLFLDIDHFKHINDTHGHSCGDAVLVEFSARLLGCVRSTDLAARFAGDEFVVVLEGLRNAGEVELVAAKIVQAMARPMRVGNLLLSVTTSIGAVHVSPEEPLEAHDLLRLADEALYQTKTRGRNGYSLHTKAKRRAA